jgi:hypothetical protein
MSESARDRALIDLLSGFKEARSTEEPALRLCTAGVRPDGLWVTERGKLVIVDPFAFRRAGDTEHCNYSTKAPCMEARLSLAVVVEELHSLGGTRLTEQLLRILPDTEYYVQTWGTLASRLGGSGKTIEVGLFFDLANLRGGLLDAWFDFEAFERKIALPASGERLAYRYATVTAKTFEDMALQESHDASRGRIVGRLRGLGYHVDVPESGTDAAEQADDLALKQALETKGPTLGKVVLVTADGADQVAGDGGYPAVCSALRARGVQVHVWSFSGRNLTSQRYRQAGIDVSNGLDNHHDCIDYTRRFDEHAERGGRASQS